MARRPSYGDMIEVPDLPDDPGPIAPPDDHPAKRDNDSTTISSYDRTSSKRGAAASRRVSAVTARERREKARNAPKAGPDEYVQRSLYARQATFDKLKKLSVENGEPIQHYYREALLLVLRKHKLAEGMTVDDV